MHSPWWWLLVVLMMVAGMAGTILPALPGTALILAAIYLGAWIDDFSRISTLTLSLVTVMAVLSWVLEYLAGVLGAKKVGASREALIGAALGTVAGLLMGLVGVLFMPLVGAAIGEYIAQHRSPPQPPASAASPTAGDVVEPGRRGRAARKAVQVGTATWVGMMIGLLAKVGLAFMMVGAFLVALAW